MARLEIVQQTSRWMPALPHKLFINDQFVGLMQTPKVDVELPQGTYQVRIQSIIPILSSTTLVRIAEGMRNVLTFFDKEKLWDIVFWVALLLELVHLFLDLPRPWNIAYHIVDNGLFILWLCYEWTIRKRYFGLTFNHYIDGKE